MTVVSPEGPPPLVVAAEGQVHQDAAADLCDYLGRVTGRTIEPGRAAPDAAVTIHVGPDAGPADPLYRSAGAQIYMLEHPQRPDVLANGDFEAGDLSGWEAGGDIAATDAGPRTGRYGAQANGTLSQDIAVKPGDRFRLTAWCRYPAAPPPGVLLCSMSVTFEGGGKNRTLEPNFRRLARAAPPGGWAALRTTFTVPPAADLATVALTSSGRTVVWDDINLEKIQEGPTVGPGTLSDGFDGEHVDAGTWVESPAGRSGALPTVGGGWLALGEGPNATLVSVRSFDDLLSGTGSRRARLRVHVARGTSDGPASFSCGIRTSTMPISISDSGFWFTHVFREAGGRENLLRTYAHQDSKLTAGPWYDIKPEMRAAGDVWYTFRFDPVEIAVYVGADGYDESEAALLGRHAHKMTDIASRGPVFLKFSGANVRLDEISLLRPGGAGVDQAATEPIPDPFAP